ncbi:Pentatricopeptide repeat-containing protein [Nymphaea thermarum]|nr:Pentatricopeptide repeat-containing protein [Nymphaea thermarum]
MPERNLVSWNSIIAVYVNVGEVEIAPLMYREGIKPNEITMVDLLSACAVLGVLTLESDFIFDCSSALVDMYSECGCLDNSCHVFVRMLSKYFVTWKSMICGSFIFV